MASHCVSHFEKDMAHIMSNQVACPVTSGELSSLVRA
jgi:hypothetical protein